MSGGELISFVIMILAGVGALLMLVWELIFRKTPEDE